MIDYMTTVYVSLAVALFLLTDIARHISLKQVTIRLKQAHMAQWIEMGSPEPTFFRRFSEYTTSRPANLALLPATENTELSLWLSRRAYEHLSDSELAVSAERYRLLVKVRLVICVAVVSGYLYLHLWAHRVVA